jgi:MFS family permease
MTFGQNLQPLRLALIAAALLPAGVAVLVLTAPSVPGAMLFAVIFGMGNGLLSIVTGTLPLTLFGSDGYGKLQGKMMSARLIVSAIAPFVLALSMQRLGFIWSLSITAALGALAVLAFRAIDGLVRNGTRFG